MSRVRKFSDVSSSLWSSSEVPHGPVLGLSGFCEGVFQRVVGLGTSRTENVSEFEEDPSQFLGVVCFSVGHWIVNIHVIGHV